MRREPGCNGHAAAHIEDVLPTKSLDYFIGSVHWLDALTPPRTNADHCGDLPIMPCALAHSDTVRCRTAGRVRTVSMRLSRSTGKIGCVAPGSYSIPSAMIEWPCALTSIANGGRRPVPCTTCPRAHVLPSMVSTFKGSKTVASQGLTTMGCTARKLYEDAIEERSVTYSRAQVLYGAFKENAQSSPLGRRTAIASIFSCVIGFTKLNFFADHGFASSSTVATKIGPSCAVGEGTENTGAGADVVWSAISGSAEALEEECDLYLDHMNIARLIEITAATITAI